jgi:hypothetical protein
VATSSATGKVHRRPVAGGPGGYASSPRCRQRAADRQQQEGRGGEQQAHVPLLRTEDVTRKEVLHAALQLGRGAGRDGVTAAGRGDPVQPRQVRGDRDPPQGAGLVLNHDRAVWRSDGHSQDGNVSCGGDPRHLGGITTGCGRSVGDQQDSRRGRPVARPDVVQGDPQRVIDDGAAKGLECADLTADGVAVGGGARQGPSGTGEADQPHPHSRRNLVE